MGFSANVTFRASYKSPRKGHDIDYSLDFDVFLPDLTEESYREVERELEEALKLITDRAGLPDAETLKTDYVIGWSEPRQTLLDETIGIIGADGSVRGYYAEGIQDGIEEYLRFREYLKHFREETEDKE